MSENSPPDQKMPVCAATAGASAGGLSPVAAGKKESLRQKGFRLQMYVCIHTDVCIYRCRKHMDTVGEGERGELRE